MANITIKGEMHSNKNDSECLQKALDSEEYTDVFYEDREPIKLENIGKNLVLYIFYCGLWSIGKVASLLQDTEIAEKRLNEYSPVDKPIDELYKDLGSLGKFQVFFYSIIFVLPAIMGLEYLLLPIKILVVTIGFTFLCTIFLVALGTWDREEFMAQQILNSIEDGNESIYVQIGEAHLIPLKWILEYHGEEVKIERTDSSFGFVNGFTTALLRVLTPIKSIKKVLKFRL